MADDMKTLPAVYAAIEAVMADVGKEGIAKGRKNQQQGYAFRGIDDVYNALAPLLAKHHLIIVPRVLSREKTERETAKGGVLFYVVVQMDFEIVCSVDGSKVTASTWGEAMDSADKATNKAMSAAYKYMAMQTFCIPTEGGEDADEVTHEVAPRREREPAPQTMSKGDARPDHAAMVQEIRACKTLEELSDWGKRNAKRAELQPQGFKMELRKEYGEKLDALHYMADSARDADRVYDEEITP